MSRDSDELEFVLRHPFSCAVVGQSLTGKSTMVFDEIIARHKEIIFPNIHKIVCVYEEWQDLYERFPNVIFVKTLGEAEELVRDGSALLVLDDQMLNYANKDCIELAKLVQVKSHHYNVSVVVILHNMFNRYFREVSFEN
jgi:hypothetical protein